MDCDACRTGQAGRSARAVRSSRERTFLISAGSTLKREPIWVITSITLQADEE